MLRCRLNSNRGFTLVELLVVIAIIALLIAILLPSLGRAREQAKKLKCLANEKDLGNASITYANSDPSEILVPTTRRTAYFVPPSCWFWGQNHFGGRGGDPRLPGNENWAHAWTSYAKFGPGERPLNAILFKNPTWESWRQAKANGNPFQPGGPRLEAHARLDMPVFHCPSDMGLQQGTGVLTEDAGGPYAQAQIPTDEPFYNIMGNSYLTHWATPLWADPTTGSLPFKGAGAIHRQLGDVPNPARCVIYREGNAKDAEYYNVPGEGDYVKVMGWHGEEMTFTATFADGHGGPVTHLVRTDASDISDDGTIVTHSGDFEMRGSRPEAVRLPYNYLADYAGEVIMRGDGWQLDFFPSPMAIVFNDFSECD